MRPAHTAPRSRAGNKPLATASGWLSRACIATLDRGGLGDPAPGSEGERFPRPIMATSRSERGRGTRRTALRPEVGGARRVGKGSAAQLSIDEGELTDDGLSGDPGLSADGGLAGLAGLSGLVGLSCTVDEFPPSAAVLACCATGESGETMLAVDGALSTLRFEVTETGVRRSSGGCASCRSSVPASSSIGAGSVVGPARALETPRAPPATTAVAAVAATTRQRVSETMGNSSWYEAYGGDLVPGSCRRGRDPGRGSAVDRGR